MPHICKAHDCLHLRKNHLSICFPLFPSLLLRLLARQQMCYILKIKNTIYFINNQTFPYVIVAGQKT